MLDLFNGVVSLQKNSFIDYPGRASALLFYSGCNLRCPFCHNATLADVKSEPDISHEEMLEFLTKRNRFLDGVVITGGEPTLYDSLPGLVAFLKGELGYDVKLDSNGLRPRLLTKIDWDYLAMDLKTSFDRYNTQLGAHGDVSEKLRRSLEIVKAAGDKAEIRITCAPGIVDDEAIESMLPELEGVQKVFLQPFKYSDDLINPKFFLGRDHLYDEDLQRFRERISTVVGKCEIRGK